MAISAFEAEVTAMAEGYADSIFLFDALKGIKPIKKFGPTCILNLSIDSTLALKQLNAHTVSVRTRMATRNWHI